mmetsp:Transcript_62867/g.115871  ORF Transcript_62867/g.115871 Transcript_62867/m.115871 type:complete len:243 (+) Transcript_62867:920-1648(+)
MYCAAEMPHAALHLWRLTALVRRMLWVVTPSIFICLGPLQKTHILKIVQCTIAISVPLHFTAPVNLVCRGTWLMISQVVPTIWRMVWKRTTSWSTTLLLSFTSFRHLGITKIVEDRKESQLQVLPSGLYPQMQHLQVSIALMPKTDGLAMLPVAVSWASTFHKCLRRLVIVLTKHLIIQMHRSFWSLIQTLPILLVLSGALLEHASTLEDFSRRSRLVVISTHTELAGVCLDAVQGISSSRI